MVSAPNEDEPSEKTYRIAMVSDFFYPNLGGVENHIWSLSYRLLQRGHKVIVITHSYGDRKGVRYLSGGLKVYYCPIAPLASNAAIPTFTATLPLIRSILLRESIQIVHAHQATSTMGSESIVYASMMGLATVYTDHSLFGFDDLAGVILNRVLQTSLATVDAAICVSHACRENFVLRTKVENVYVIPNAVDSTKFTPLQVEEESIQTKKRIKVGVISRLVYRKGVDLLVGIIPSVCARLETVDFIVGGSGAKLLDLQEMVERERLQDRVKFLGSVPHSQVRDVLVECDVFLNCSLTESFCIAILEAACCGLLVVSTNVGGVPEVLPPDMIFLTEPTLPCMVERLTAAIQRQLDEPVNRWETHRRIRDMYSWQRVAAETEQVYDVIHHHDRKSLSERLLCYQSIGHMSGLVACFLALTIELWFRYVEWWMPRETISVAPSTSLFHSPSNSTTDKGKASKS